MKEPSRPGPDPTLVTFEFENDAQPKSDICNKILRALPQWFGIEEAIEEYVQGVRDQLFVKALYSSDPIGFCSIKVNYGNNADLYVLGILCEYHGLGIGTALVNFVRDYCIKRDIRYMTVKTLSERHPDTNYAKTRRFYEKCGFRPLEEFPSLWGESSPCLYMIMEV